MRCSRCPGYHGVLAYTLPEALWLAGPTAGRIQDVVVGYPSVDRAALARLAIDETLASRVTVMIDDVEQLDLIDAVAPPAKRNAIRVCLELDASFHAPVLGHLGVRRSPVHTPEQARALAEAIVARPGFTLVGMMALRGADRRRRQQGPGQARPCAGDAAGVGRRARRAARRRGRRRARRSPTSSSSTAAAPARSRPPTPTRASPRSPRAPACSARTCSTATGSSRRRPPRPSPSASCAAPPPTSRRSSAAAGSHPARPPPTACRSSPGPRGSGCCPAKAPERSRPRSPAPPPAGSRSATGCGCATPRPES